MEKEARVPRPGFQTRAAESCGCCVGKSGKRDGTRGTGPRTPSCGSRLPASGALSVPDPSPAPGPGPEIGRRTPLTQRQAEPGTKVVGTAKAAAPCRGSGPRQGPRPPARPALLGRKLEAGRARLPQEKSGKVPPPPRAAPQPGHQGQVLTAPGFVSAQRTAQKCGTRRPGALPAGLTCSYSPRTPMRATERPAERQEEVTDATCPFPSSPDQGQQLCVTRRGRGRRGCG